MALITAAVAGTGVAMGAATIHHFSSDHAQAIEVSSDACAKTIGIAMCLGADCWRKATRHVTVIGDVLVLSRTPGSADSMLSLTGTHIDVTGHILKIISPSGGTVSTFWLNSSEEASRWAKELDARPKDVPKLLSLNRQQMEKIRAEAALWEEKISLARDSKSHREKLLVEVAMKEQRMAELTEELDGFKDLPKTLSLDRHQIEELEKASKDKEGQVAALQEQLEAYQTMPKMLSLNRKQIAQLEQKAVSEKGKIADLHNELACFEEQAKRLAVENEKVAALKTKHSEKDTLIDTLKGKVNQLQELPKMLSIRRQDAERKEAEQDEKIAALERELAQAQSLPKMLSLNRRQAEEVVDRSNKIDLELSQLRQQLLAHRAKDLLKPRVISTTTRSYQGTPVVVKSSSSSLAGIAEYPAVGA